MVISSKESSQTSLLKDKPVVPKDKNINKKEQSLAKNKGQITDINLIIKTREKRIKKAEAITRAKKKAIEERL